MVLPTAVQKDCRLWILYIHHRSKWMPNENCWSISQMELWTQAWTYLRKKVLQQWRLADIITMIKCYLFFIRIYLHICIHIHGLGNGCYKRDVDYLGHDVNNGHQTLTDSAKECQQLCEKHPACVVFSWISANVPEGPFKERERECWLKHTEPNGTPRQYVVSGPKRCGKYEFSNIQ